MTCLKHPLVDPERVLVVKRRIAAKHLKHEDTCGDSRRGACAQTPNSSLGDSVRAVPRAHQSTALPWPSPWMISGAKYSGVPQIVQVLTRRRMSFDEFTVEVTLGLSECGWWWHVPVLNLFGEAKVSHLDVPIHVEEEVLWLQVAVADVFAVQIV